MRQFILYGTLGCHLCELAEQRLAALMAQLPQPIEIECRDIADSDALVERYGVRIPVLRRVADDAELGWPFEDAALREFVGA